MMVKNTPWIKHWYSSRRRCADKNCKDYKDYGARNIKCLLSKEEIKELWYRDKACLMEQPTIDRIDNDGNYTFDNCQFLENRDNTIKRNKNYGKAIIQYSLDDNFIKEWESGAKASRALKISKGNISAALVGRYKQANGFKWRFKNER
jgi:hypothetical protein